MEGCARADRHPATRNRNRLIGQQLPVRSWLWTLPYEGNACSRHFECLRGNKYAESTRRRRRCLGPVTLPPSIVRSAAVVATVNPGIAHTKNFLSAHDLAAVGCCDPLPERLLVSSGVLHQVITLLNRALTRNRSAFFMFKSSINTPYYYSDIPTLVLLGFRNTVAWDFQGKRT